MNRRAELRLAPKDKVVAHPQFADYLADKKIYPIGLEISPSGVCNASCDFCLVAGTMIDTAAGLLPIESIQEFNCIWSPDGTQTLVTRIWKREVDATLLVQCDGREIRVTPEHPFLTETGWKRAEELRSGDSTVMRMRMRDLRDCASREMKSILHKQSCGSWPNSEPEREGHRFGADDPSLREIQLAVPGDLLEAEQADHNSWIESRDRVVRFTGIKLERGLELRSIDSIRRIEGRVTVYNLSCDPVEAYEANGFVVHNCFYANTGELGDHRKVFLKTDRAVTLLDEAAALAVKAITWTGGGDPSLHPKIGCLVERAHAVGMDQGMFTNALAHPSYDPSLLSWIRITMTDKPFKPNYIKMLRKCPVLGFAFNYSGEQDLPYLWETLHLADEVRADYVQVRPALAFHGATVDIKPPTIEHPLLHITDYKFDDAKRPHGDYKACEGFHFVPFIWETGDVDVCAYMRKWEGYGLGNIYKNSLKSILDDAPKSVAVTHECQVCCKLHEINQTIHAARKLEDINFP